MTTIVRMLAVMALMLAASLRAGAEQGAVGARARSAGQDDAAHLQRRQRHRQLRRSSTPSSPSRSASSFRPSGWRETFQDFNKKHIDFDIIAAMKPGYDPAPKVDDDGKLLVKGYFPTEPLRVYFDLEFIPSDGEWKLISINVKVDDPK